jgi:RES domain-containing protein
VILYRCAAWNRAASPREPDGPLWFPREFQGEGRHDNPGVYGCLYLADRAVSCLIEQLAAFRGQRLSAPVLRRRGLPLALAAIEFDDDLRLVDLDEPATLRRERLRPSRVATRERSISQPQALALHQRHPEAAGLRWWSCWEGLWANVTVFDRAAPALRLRDVRELTIDDPAVRDAAERFGLRVLS